MIRRPPRSTPLYSSAASDVYKRQTQVHVTVNGLGERAGNASLEELVMTLESLYNYKTRLKTTELYLVSRLVSRLTGVPVAQNKPIVGENAFTHESGIHCLLY